MTVMGWFRKQKVKDFVSPSQEQREALGEGVKDLLAGKMLVDQGLKRNIKFIVFLMVIGIVYIANGYHMEKLYVEKVALEKEVDELRFESITTASELMRLSVQSEVEKRIREAGLDLGQSRVPPVKIVK